MAAKFFTGLPMDGPDPECVLGNSEEALASRVAAPPKSAVDHSRKRIVNGVETPNPLPSRVFSPERIPDRACDEDPLADFWAGTEKAMN
jgi:hypothetical protein